MSVRAVSCFSPFFVLCCRCLVCLLLSLVGHVYFSYAIIVLCLSNTTGNTL